MYKIVIVDDEPLILAGIASMVSWEDYDCRIVGKASNGQQALKLMEELRPDLVITDIKMPSMDGITFIRKAKEQGQTAEFIILTNLEEFSLAKEAVRLGAVDYLVKMELTEERLIEVLERAKQQRETFVQSQEGKMGVGPAKEEMIEYYFHQLMLYEEEEKIEKQIRKLVEERFREIALVMLQINYGYDMQESDFNHEEKIKMLGAVEDIIREMTKHYFEDFCILRREKHTFLLIVSVEREDYQQKVCEMTGKFCTVLKDYFEISLTIAGSGRTDAPYKFLELLYQASSAMNYAYGEKPGIPVFYQENWEETKGRSSNFNISFLKKDLERTFFLNDSESFKKKIDEIIDLFKEYKPSRIQAVHACINLYYFVNSFFEREGMIFSDSENVMEQLNRMGNLEELSEWLNQFSIKVTAAMRKSRENGLDKHVEKAISYVENHYTEKITLSQVADNLNISLGYLSSNFKKQVGKNFTDYVMERKIKKAEELIRERKYMLYEISDMLGFDNQFYFSKVFKKIVGVSPKEYESIGRFGR